MNTYRYYIYHGEVHFTDAPVGSRVRFALPPMVFAIDESTPPFYAPVPMRFASRPVKALELSESPPLEVVMNIIERRERVDVRHELHQCEAGVRDAAKRIGWALERLGVAKERLDVAKEEGYVFCDDMLEIVRYREAEVFKAKGEYWEARRKLCLCLLAIGAITEEECERRMKEQML